jgi:hypothetical protein
MKFHADGLNADSHDSNHCDYNNHSSFTQSLIWKPDIAELTQKSVITTFNPERVQHNLG